MSRSLRHLTADMALAALENLSRGRQQVRHIFPEDFLHGYRKCTEDLRAETNRDLLRRMAEHEGQDASRFAIPLTARDAKRAKP